MNKKQPTKPQKTKEELIQEYEALKKQKNSWWNVLAYENNSVKTITGGFFLYIGYLAVSAFKIDLLILIYAIGVVAVVWYWVDMLRTQYEHNNKDYKQKMRLLHTEILKWSKKKIVAENPALQITEKRTHHIAQTILPYIWGFAPESIEQFDEYQYELAGQCINISYIQIQQEKAKKEYWFLAIELPQKFEEESTSILPLPYYHDKWQKIEFNDQITSPEFKQKYSIFSSQFMHSYYLISQNLLQKFLALPTDDKWLVFRKNKAYLLLPKKAIDWDIYQLDKAHETAKEQIEKMMKISNFLVPILE